MSFKVEVHGIGDKDYTSNAVRFATREEAQESGQDLFSRWYGIDDFRVAESNDPVNYGNYILDAHETPFIAKTLQSELGLDFLS